MPDFALRRITFKIEEILHQSGPVAAPMHLINATLAAVKNAFSGGFEPNLQPAMEDVNPSFRC